MKRAMKRFAEILTLAAGLSAAGIEAATRHVDPAHPAARDAGEGPYRTIGYAMKRLMPGDVLEIAPGVYREALVFPERDWSAGPTLIRGVGESPALIKGSEVVTGWEPLGNGLFVKRPWTVNSQQVFVDGAPLQQIGGTILNGYPDKPNHPMKRLHASQGGIWPGRVPGGLEAMTDHSFYYDQSSRSLYIKIPLASLAGRTVEVSVQPYLVLGQGLRGVTLKNLRFQHANTTAVSQAGAVTLSGDDLVLENIDIAWVDGNGLDITGDRNEIKNSRASFCGQVGMKVRGRANRLLHNETSFNNTRGFNKWWEAGGAKFVGAGGLQDSEVAGHRAIGNRGDGLWFDWMNRNNRVHGGVFAYNAGFGIHYEASRQGYFHDNYVFGNKQRGIYLPDSSDSVVAHNLVAANGMEGIAVVDEAGARGGQGAGLEPRGNRVLGNIVAWNGKAALVLPEDGLNNTSDHNLFLTDKDPPSFSQGWGSRGRPMRQGLPQWTAASGQDAHSWSEALALPAELLAALNRRDPDPDWSPVLSWADRFRVPRLQGAGSASHPRAPGPAR